MLRLPRVALLVLTRGGLHHHQTWNRWFEAARDQLPSEQLRAAACAPAAATAGAPAPEPANAAQPAEQGGEGAAERPAFEAVAAACGWNFSAGQALAPEQGGFGGASAIAQQHLFSVYIHAPPSITGETVRLCLLGRRSPWGGGGVGVRWGGKRGFRWQDGPRCCWRQAAITEL